ncbi:Heterokaryon incompatibility protein 6,OR allele [Lachnellula subtilissima]|uniref:Heterokaryon incompatibility protein 6,OR allele n=1 Tax=Lachnellula subtilissima TaxID=602034 RepID=A0A8H8RTB5_9HELO|nr:Heterokaryon incompatibility protein 6,OR allele [Lachnellula subtilissima]
MFSKKVDSNELAGRIEDLEQRMGRLEASLNQVIQNFRMPVVESHHRTIHKPTYTSPPVHDATPSTASVQKPAQTNAPIYKTESTLNSSPFVYQPLDVRAREIRVLVLQSSLKDDDPIRCELVHIGLDEDITTLRARSHFRTGLMNFNTLSYTWGDPNNNRAVILEGHRFPVRENLHAALRHLRNSHRSASSSNSITKSYWWVDAMCINQENVSERNDQVSLMTRIYKKSFGVHIWLGDEAENSSLAMDLISELGRWRPRGPGDPVGGDRVFRSDMKMHWKALNALFQRSYWSRVWIRQEVAVSKFAMVHCGNRICQWDDISAALNVILTLNQQLGYQPAQEGLNQLGISCKSSSGLGLSCYLRAFLLCRIRTEAGGGTDTNYLELKDLLFHTRGCEATDPRDKVFSMLGLASPAIYDMQPDYNSRIEEVLKTAAICVISRTKSLDLLGGCQNSTRLYGLPSWVPNLLDDWKSLPFDTTYHIRNWEDCIGENDFGFGGRNKSILQVRGRRVGSIKTLVNGPNQSDSAKQLEAVLANWKEVVTIKASRPGNDKYSQRFLELLVGGKNDQYWLNMLSLGVDSGAGLRYAKDGRLLPDETPVNHHNPKMVQKLLAPDVETAASRVGNAQIHSHLRRVGVGRKLGFLEDGSQGLLPADTMIGDEICYFRRTSFPYVLRKASKDTDTYFLVGEACEYRDSLPMVA